MREIIGEQPSTSPVGLGNSASAVDISVLESKEETPTQGDAQGEASTQDEAPTESQPRTILNDSIVQELLDTEPGTSEAGDEHSSHVGDDDLASDHDQAPRGEKRKAAASSSPGPSDIDVKPLKPCDSSDKSAKRPKKLLKLEEFSSAVAAEEVTHQKQLELKAKVEVAGNVKIEQEKATVVKKQMDYELWMQAEKHKFELVRQKQELKHQRALARLTSQAHQAYPRQGDFYGGYGADHGAAGAADVNYNQDLMLPPIPNDQGVI